ncbi:hypothetical protein BDB01DRAFT_305016 [Pilobolus umbonatus]|nr:hypothetical protein BDB01DRAFT_305016 [Pilobolus umbonatus]
MKYRQRLWSFVPHQPFVLIIVTMGYYNYPIWCTETIDYMSYKYNNKVWISHSDPVVYSICCLHMDEIITNLVIPMMIGNLLMFF